MANDTLLSIVIATLGALVSFALMALHPIGPGLFLAVISPFDALFAGLFGVAGNAVTFLPILVLLIRVPAGQIIRLFVGSSIQIAFMVFLAALSISHFMVVDDLGIAAILEYGRKITVFLLVGTFAWSMNSADHLFKMIRYLVLSMSSFVVISLLDFYLGIHILPGAADTFGGVLGLSLDDVGVHTLRFNGGGLTINQTANWLLVPIFMSLGWLLAPQSRGRALAFLCLTVCVTGLGATISRSGILGLATGALVLFPVALRRGGSQVVLGSIATAIAMLCALLVLDQVGFSNVLLGRFTGGDDGSQMNQIGRGVVFGSALRLFALSPIIGIGDSMVAFHPKGIGLGAHNSFLGLLAEAGLVGALPYLVLVAMVFFRLARRLPTRVDAGYEHWRPYFLASYVACMVQSSFNEYTWERMTWFVVAFAVALEVQTARVGAKQRVEVRSAWELGPNVA